MQNLYSPLRQIYTSSFQELSIQTVQNGKVGEWMKFNETNHQLQPYLYVYPKYP